VNFIFIVVMGLCCCLAVRWTRNQITGGWHVD